MENTEVKNSLTKEVLHKAMTYESYHQLIKNLLEENKTTGPDQSGKMINYTRLNFQRMKRVYKITQLDSELAEAVQKLNRKLTWLVLTEAWCGDAAQNIPVLAKIAEESENIDLQLILRDEHLDIMDNYLTNGGRSIPKLICLDQDTFEELGTWGPRPEPFQKMVLHYKENPIEDYESFTENLHKKYNEDKAQTIQSELLILLHQWSNN